ncbi:unnamed protein product [Heterobilharzia americana]|nr:unnamed protein product [Heterobilharzia americana]
MINKVKVNCWFKQCGRCQLKVPEDAKVHKVNRIPFHISCFTCFQCGRQLCQGDKCGIFNNDVFCYEHYVSKCLSIKMLQFDTDSASNMNTVDSSQFNKFQQILLKQENFTVNLNDEKINQNFNQSHMHLPNYTAKSDRIAVLNANCCVPSTSTQLIESTAKNESADNFSVSSNYSTASYMQTVTSSTTTLTSTNKIENCQSTDNWYSVDDSMLSEEILLSNGDISLTLTENGHSVDSSTSSNCSVHSKSKRIRTSFTPDQLAILQANFDVEANPDGQELERIAGMAKLNKRVTQVWFQNARARKKKIECRGHLGGQHDQISLSSLACCLSDPTGTEEFFDNSKENIPSININERISSTNDCEITDSNQLYERQFNGKVDFFNEINYNAKNNHSSTSNGEKHFSGIHCCRMDNIFANGCSDHGGLISNGCELNFSDKNNIMDHDTFLNRLLPNTNPFGKFPFPSAYGPCIPLPDTLPHQCDHNERINNERYPTDIKNVINTAGTNNYGNNNNGNNNANIVPITYNTVESGSVEDVSMDSQNSTSVTRCGPRPYLHTDQNMFNPIPSDHRSSNNFYIPAIALPTN